MQTLITASITGAEQPGLIQKLARITHKHGGKWLSSKVSRLDGLFAGLFKIEIASDEADALQHAMQLAVPYPVQFIRPVKPAEQAVVTRDLEISSQDRSGLVSDITQVMVDHGVVIENMHCGRFAAGGLDMPMFQASMTLRLPRALELEQLTAELNTVVPGVNIHWQ